MTIREAMTVDLALDASGPALAAVCEALGRAGFAPGRVEPGYVEARRGTASPFRLVSRMSVTDTPVVVCVAINVTPAGAQASIAAYPDLGGWVLMGPISRRKWRAAMQEAVVIAAQAAQAGRSVGQVA